MACKTVVRTPGTTVGPHVTIHWKRREHGERKITQEIVERRVREREGGRERKREQNVERERERERRT